MNSECIDMIDNLSDHMTINKICADIGIPKSSYYYWKKKKEDQREKETSKYQPSWSLLLEEKEMILSIMNSEDYYDKSPAYIYYSLLDSGVYLCSIRSMYRILKENNQSKERRKIIHHGKYEKPELLAEKPNEVWSWDITKLKGPAKWIYYYLYVIIDIFSRYVVGWHIAYREESQIAKELIYQSLLKQEISKDQLTIHADRGSSMRSKPVAVLLSDLGVTKSHSRPYQSNDNPYSESQFKTLKYQPLFPERFENIESARDYCRDFFQWYNQEHYHSGIGYYTPESVHYGYCNEIYNNRREVLLDAYFTNPGRFRNKIPRPLKPPKEAWINQPKKEVIKTKCY